MRTDPIGRLRERGTVGVAQAAFADLPVDASDLSADERARAGRFVFGTDRDRFIAGRAWVRRHMAAILGRPARALRLIADTHGKPGLDDPDRPIAFNVSHTRQRITLAVARDPVGIDIENRVPDDLDGVADLVMSPSERTAFAALATDRLRRAAFVRLWTRKEALLKAIGTGLLTEPRTATVGLGPPDDTPETVADPHVPARAWTVRSFRAGADTVGAVALAGTALTVVGLPVPAAPEPTASR